MMSSLFLSKKNISIIGAGFGLGQTQAGTEKAPSAILKAGLEKSIEKIGWEISNIIAFEIEDERLRKQPQASHPYNRQLDAPTIHYVQQAGNACDQVSTHARTIAKSHTFCLTLGGDHSIAIGSIDGLLQAWPELCVIWVDAHGDFNTPQSSPSGNLHGMPLAALTGLFKLSNYPGFANFKAHIPAERIALIGVRSIDEQEIKYIEESGAHLYTMSEVDRYGIGPVMSHAMQSIDPLGKRPLHLSFDIDALDPSIAPSTGTSVRGGLNYREAHYIAEESARSNRLVSMDMVEVNPDLAKTAECSKTTIEMAIELIESALGKRTAPPKDLS